MSGKEIIRMLLCLTGYDRNVKVESYYGEGGAIGYDFSGENEECDSFGDINCEGLQYNVYSILENYREKNKISDGFSWMNYPLSVFKTDVAVNKERFNLDEKKKKHEKAMKDNEPIINFLKKNNPCSYDCPLNKHDYEPPFHYHCQKLYSHNCPRLKKFEDDFNAYREQHRKKLKENEEQLLEKSIEIINEWLIKKKES